MRGQRFGFDGQHLVDYVEKCINRDREAKMEMKRVELEHERKLKEIELEHQRKLKEMELEHQWKLNLKEKEIGGKIEIEKTSKFEDGKKLNRNEDNVDDTAKHCLAKKPSSAQSNYNKRTVSMFVPAHLCGKIIGHKGFKIHKIQDSTGCKISVTWKNESDGTRHVILCGTKNAIQLAEQSIHNILHREKLRQLTWTKKQIEKGRDYCFRQLCDIWDLCMENREDAMVKRIMDIL